MISNNMVVTVSYTHTERPRGLVKHTCWRVGVGQGGPYTGGLASSLCFPAAMHTALVLCHSLAL